MPDSDQYGIQLCFEMKDQGIQTAETRKIILSAKGSGLECKDAKAKDEKQRMERKTKGFMETFWSFF